MSIRNEWGVLAAVCCFWLLAPCAMADDASSTQPAQDQTQTQEQAPAPDLLYTNAGLLVGGMNSSANYGGGSSSSSSFYMLGVDGDYGFDKLFPGGQYLNVGGSIIGGTDSGYDVGFTGVTAGVGGHYEFEPSTAGVDLGKISAFAMLVEQYNYLTVALPTYTYNGQTYGGGNSSSSSSSSAIEYGVKWMILNAYEWDFYGVNGSSSSSSGSQSPIGGNSLNLKFKWLMEPKPDSPYLGVYYSHQSQTGVNSDSLMVIGGYIW